MWLIIILSSYFLLSLVSIVDKHLLKSRIPQPKIYAFYIGVLGLAALIFAPFGFLKIPSLLILLLALLAGFFNIFAILFLFSALKKYEASRIIPAVGALTPIFTFSFTFLFSQAKGIGINYIIAFVFIILGTMIITYEGRNFLNGKSLKESFLVAFLFAVFFILIKFVYLSHPFISGLIWSRIGAFLVALLFLFSKDVRSDILGGTKIMKEKTWLIVLPSQFLAAMAVFLQNWAIALAPFAYLGIINALEGTRYFFLLFFTVIISRKFPSIIKEEISLRIILQKLLAILFMVAGLAILYLK